MFLSFFFIESLLNFGNKIFFQFSSKPPTTPKMFPNQKSISWFMKAGCHYSQVKKALLIAAETVFGEFPFLPASQPLVLSSPRFTILCITFSNQAWALFLGSGPTMHTRRSFVLGTTVFFIQEQICSNVFVWRKFLSGPPFRISIPLSLNSYLLILPDRTFPHYTASKSSDWRMLCSSETLMIEWFKGLFFYNWVGMFFVFLWNVVGKKRESYRCYMGKMRNLFKTP